MSSKRKSKDVSDPQAEKLYAWTFEWADWNRKTISLADCRKLIRKACKAAKITPPTVTSAPQSRHYSFHCEELNRIELVPSHQNVAIALHEVTHAICAKHFPGCQGHGPSFAGVYLDLLSQTGIAPPEALYASARKAGIKIRRAKKKAR